MNELLEDNVYLTDFAEFPQFSLIPGKGSLVFNHYSKHKTIRDVNDTRMEYFAQRLAQAEDRIFSHVDMYQRAKLVEKKNQTSIKTVYNVHAVLGSPDRKWVLGLISQKEDGHYYLEDGTYSVQVTFSELEWVEQDAFFTEMCIIMAEGHFDNGMFYVHNVMHPPLHANKSFKFHLNEQDYFGSYTRMTENMMFKNKYAGQTLNELPKQLVEREMEPCVVIINQAQIDKAKHFKTFEEIFTGLEQLCPEIIVLIGDFTSPENNEVDQFEKLKQNFEQIGGIIRSNNLECLRESTQWIIMPSTQDAGICQIMPGFKMSDYLIEGFKGKGPQRIKKIMLATNPMRMSFRGKEMVFCRYNYFKKIKKNHLEKFQKQQEKQMKQENKSADF